MELFQKYYLNIYPLILFFYFVITKPSRNLFSVQNVGNMDSGSEIIGVIPAYKSVMSVHKKNAPVIHSCDTQQKLAFFIKSQKNCLTKSIS